MKSKNLAENTAIITYLVIILALVVGWVVNLVWLIRYTGEATGEFFVALAGAFIFPFGAIHGWITLF